MDKTYAGMSYEEVVEKYSDYITRMCVVWTQNEEAAKDCFQNTFIKLYKSSKTFNDSEHLKAWLLLSLIHIQMCIRDRVSRIGENHGRKNFES